MYIFNRILPPIITGQQEHPHSHPHHHHQHHHHQQQYSDTHTPDILSSPANSTTSSAIHRTLTKVRARGDYDYEDSLATFEEEEEEYQIDYDDEELYYVTTPTEKKRPQLPLVAQEEREIEEAKRRSLEDHKKLQLRVTVEEVEDREKGSWVGSPGLRITSPTLQRRVTSPAVNINNNNNNAASRGNTPDPYAWAFKSQELRKQAVSRNSIGSLQQRHSPPDTTTTVATVHVIPEPISSPDIRTQEHLSYEEQVLAAQRADEQAVIAEKLALLTRRREQEGFPEAPNRFLQRAQTLPVIPTVPTEKPQHRSYEEEALAHRRLEDEEFLSDKLAVLARRRASQAAQEARDLASTPIESIHGQFSPQESPETSQILPPKPQQQQQQQQQQQRKRISIQEEVAEYEEDLASQHHHYEQELAAQQYQGRYSQQVSPESSQQLPPRPTYQEEPVVEVRQTQHLPPPPQQRRSYHEEVATPPPQPQQRRSYHEEVATPPPQQRRSYHEEVATPPPQQGRSYHEEVATPPPQQRRSYHEEVATPPPAPQQQQQRRSYHEEVVVAKHTPSPPRQQTQKRRSHQEAVATIQREYEEDITSRQLQYQQEISVQQYQEVDISKKQREYEETIAFRQKEYEDAIARQLQRQRSFDEAKEQGTYGVENFEHHFDPSGPPSPTATRNPSSGYIMSAPAVRYVDASQLTRDDIERSMDRKDENAPPMPPRPGRGGYSGGGYNGRYDNRGQFSPHSASSGSGSSYTPPPAYENAGYGRHRDEAEREENLMKAAILASQQKDAYDQILDKQKLELEEAELLVALEESKRLQKEDEEFYATLAASAAQAKEEEAQNNSRNRDSYGSGSGARGYPELSQNNNQGGNQPGRHDDDYTGYSAVTSSYNYGMPPKVDQSSFVAQYQPAGRLSQHPQSKGPGKAESGGPSTKVSEDYYSGIISNRNGGGESSTVTSPREGESPAQKRFREMLQSQAAEAASVANNSSGYEGGSLSRYE